MGDIEDVESKINELNAQSKARALRLKNWEKIFIVTFVVYTLFVVWLIYSLGRCQGWA